MSKKKKNKLKKGTYRCIKISAEALYEFVYEKFIEDQDYYMDVESLKVSNTFAFDPESGDFIFCTYRSEDKDGNRVTFPKRVDINKLLRAMPDTTDTMFDDDRYRDYTEEQLVKQQRLGRVRVKKSK